MARVIETRRCGLIVYVATILVEGRCRLESVHMSEGGARAWVTRTLDKLAVSERNKRTAA